MTKMNKQWRLKARPVGEPSAETWDYTETEIPTITDGQLGDDDLAANGVIKDPGGPVIQNGPLPGDAISVPGLTPLATALLSLLMLLAWGGYQHFQPGKRRTASRSVLEGRFHGE